MSFWNSVFTWAAGLALVVAATPAHASVDISVMSAGDTRSNIEPTFSNYNYPPSAIKHVVASGGSDSNVGDDTHPWATIKHAVESLQAGQKLYVHAGVYSAYVNLDNAQSGSADAPITVMAAPGESKPIITPIASPSSDPHSSYYVFRPSKSYWIFDGLVFDLGQNRAVAFRISSGPDGSTTTAHHILVSHCEIHNGQGPSAISTDHASDVFVENNIISNNYRPGVCSTNTDCAPEDTAAVASSYVCEDQLCKGPKNCTSHSDCSRGYYCEPVASNPDDGRVCRKRDDLHAVEVARFSQSVTIEQNQLFDNSGDGLQCNGPLYGGGTDVVKPKNVTFLDNDAYATSASYGTDHIGLFGTSENAVDIKDCDHVTVRGGNFHGFRGVGKADNGSAITTHNNSTKVLIDQVDAWDSCIGLSMGSTSGTDEETMVHDFVVRRSQFHDMASSCAKRFGFVFSAAEGVDAYHNIFSNINGKAVSVGEEASNGRYCSDIDIWNSVFNESSGSARWITADGRYSQDVETDYNLFYNSDGLDTHFLCNGTSGGVTAWQNCTSGGGLTTREPDHGTVVHVGNPNFVNLTVSSWDFHTQAGPARDTADATAGITDTYCGLGPDKGRFESDCDLNVWTERGTTGFTGTDPSMRLDSGGKPVVAWTGFTSSQSGIVRLSKWTGTTWQSLASATAQTYNPALALDSSDTPIVAWLEWNPTAQSYDVRVQSWTGTAWQPIGGVVSSLGLSANSYNGPSNVHIQLELDGLGNPVVAFNGGDSTGLNGYVFRWDPSLSQWLAVGGALHANTGSAVVISMSLQLNSGNPVVAWSELFGTNSTYVYVQQWTGSAWQSYGSALTVNTPSPRANFPSLRMYAGNPVVAFSDLNPTGYNDIYVKKWSGSAWVDVGSSLNAVAGTSTNAGIPAMALDSAGNPTVAWSEANGATTNYKMYVQHWNGSTWVPLVGDLTGTGTASPYISHRTSLEYYNSYLFLSWDAMTSDWAWYLYHTGP